LKVL
jgi:hypothetical protein